MAARDLKSVTYTDDYGNIFATKVDSGVFAQVDGSGNPIVGGADYAATPARAPLPAQLRPRHVIVSAAGRPKRRVICLTADAPLFTGAETSVSLKDLGGANVAFTRYAAENERYPVHQDPNG